MDTSSNSRQTTTNPRTTVRTNWLRYSWNQISNASKVLLLVSFTMALLQISSTVAILVYGNLNQLSCEKPLQLYLIVFVVRAGTALPISIYQQLFTPTSQRNQRRTVDNDASTSSPTTENTTQPASLLTGWLDKIKSLLDLFAVLWFIVGNYLAFSPSSCPTNAAPYYYTILTWVLAGYILIIIPFIAFASVIFCLPCVLVTMRTFNINVSTVMVGGSKEEIASIPVFKYKAMNETTVDEEAVVPSVKKPSFIRRFMHLKSTKQVPQHQENLQTLTIPKQEDAICSICLCEYEANELVCKLWCQHHYHKDCVQEWLGLNSKCPLCKRDFRGKGYLDDSNSEEEQY